MANAAPTFIAGYSTPTRITLTHSSAHIANTIFAYRKAVYVMREMRKRKKIHREEARNKKGAEGRGEERRGREGKEGEEVAWKRD